MMMKLMMMMMIVCEKEVCVLCAGVRLIERDKEFGEIPSVILCDFTLHFKP